MFLSTSTSCRRCLWNVLTVDVAFTKIPVLWSFDMLSQGPCTPGGRAPGQVPDVASIPVEKCSMSCFCKCAPSSSGYPFNKMFSSHDQLLPLNWSKSIFLLLCSDWLINPTVLPSVGSVIPSVPSRISVQISGLLELHLKGKQSYARGGIFIKIACFGFIFHSWSWCQKIKIKGHGGQQFLRQ